MRCGHNKGWIVLRLRIRIHPNFIICSSEYPYPKLFSEKLPARLASTCPVAPARHKPHFEGTSQIASISTVASLILRWASLPFALARGFGRGISGHIRRWARRENPTKSTKTPVEMMGI
jgi:hypothetical protein